MKNVVEFKLDDDTPVFVEIEDSHAAYGTQRVSRGGREAAIEGTENRFKDAIARIKPAAEMVSV